MVLMLELVGIGVFGACLSALLCMITEGTPCKVPKIISFKEGSLKPRIIRSVNWPRWKSAINSKDKGRRQTCRQKIDDLTESKPQNVRRKIHRSYKEHLRTSVHNLQSYTQTMANKAVNNINEYWKEDHKCKHCRNLEKLNHPRFMQAKKNKTQQMIKKSVSRIKTAIVGNKNDDSCKKSRELYNNWTKVRVKERRFILPKHLIIAKRPNGADAEEATKADSFENSINGEF